jgi:hypothetical protein
MHSADLRLLQQPAFELRFPSFCAAGHALAFALDAGGTDALGERALDYLFARALLGHDYGWPNVLASHRRS